MRLRQLQKLWHARTGRNRTFRSYEYELRKSLVTRYHSATNTKIPKSRLSGSWFRCPLELV
eukprot:scaffold95496_cov17-Prasinocladus_malaysianus.AAC.1